MAAMSAVFLLSLVLLIFIFLSTTYRGRTRWILLTTFSLLFVLLVGGLFAYITNHTFRREFSIFFQSTSQYADGERNAVLPLPDHTAFDYRYAEHAVVYFTNKSPQEVIAFYQTLKGLTMKEGPAPSPGMSFYHVTYKGKDLTVTIIPQDQSFGCQIAVASD